jgi:SAM-dependent methyltransferase
VSLRDTDQDWAVLAQTQPYWAVLSAEIYRGQTLDPAARAAFFGSGEQQVAALMGFAKRHLDPAFAPRRALDFGCGVGRLLLPLARLVALATPHPPAPAAAVGVDIAPAMIELCRANLAEAGLHHAEVVLGDDTLSRVDGRFDLVNSLIVLQHIPPERGYRLIARLLDLLEVGGVGSLQLTYAKERRFFTHEAPRARYYRRDGDTLRDLSPLDTEQPQGTIAMYDYDLNQIMLMIAAVAGHPILALPSHDDGHAGFHFVFRRAR